jgi:hypothetical protein
MAAKDVVANLVNTKSSKDSEDEEDWALNAVKLASSSSKEEAATLISSELQYIMNRTEKKARDTIALILNQRRKANFRVDKSMASNIRSCQFFRLNPKMIGKMSIFHCYPRPPLELQDFMSGEEMETKMKAKALTPKLVSGFFEQRLGIALSANKFTRQFFNFWQYNIVMFGENSWLTQKVGELYEVFKELEEEIDEMAENDEEYILVLAAIVNNDYHRFLLSCIKANEDITKVKWRYLEKTADTITTLVQSQQKSNFVLTRIYKELLEQTKRDQKRKRNAEDDDEEASDEKRGKRNKFRKFKKNGDGNPDRETDPEKINENVRDNWKMSANEFRKVISPHLADCPKLDNKNVCAMYNIVGRCYFGSQCRHSHDDLSDNAAEEMDKWIIECKKKAKDSPNNKHKKGKKKDD